MNNSVCIVQSFWTMRKLLIQLSHLNIRTCMINVLNHTPFNMEIKYEKNAYILDQEPTPRQLTMLYYSWILCFFAVIFFTRFVFVEYNKRCDNLTICFVCRFTLSRQNSKTSSFFFNRKLRKKKNRKYFCKYVTISS